MTNKEAIQAILGQFQLRDDSLQLALLDAGVNPDDTYDNANATVIGGAACDILVGALSASSISEGGFSISYSRDGIVSLLKYLAKKYGRDDLLDSFTPTISNAPVW